MTGLADRMKRYEDCFDTVLMPKTPVVIRIDGKKFSRYTATFTKPFDEAFANAMAQATQHTASMIEGCMVGFTGSDEATFVLRNDQSTESEPWFGNRIQKIVSVAASIFTASFNSYMAGLPLAYFDARVFAVPDVQEAMNCLLWRQRDITRNSYQTAAYWEISKTKGRKTTQGMMNGIKSEGLQELLFRETGLNWNDYPTKYKRGVACYKEYTTTMVDDKEVIRSNWKTDLETPIFSQDREFLKNILAFRVKNET